MSDEAKPVNEASRVLFLQEAQRHAQEVNAIAAMARRVDGMPADSVIDLDTLTYAPK
jgi:hypothetical protein